MTRAVLILTSIAAIGSTLMAGTFFAFSTFVMKGLARLPAADGVRAMQAINLAVVPSTFLAVFMGTALVALSLVAASMTSATPTGARAGILTASALYLVGAFLVTVACNVPRNEALAVLDPENAGTAGFWARYLVEWTAWNHVRTVASLLAAVAFARAAFTMSAEAWSR